MKVIGITGNIACGKSVISSYLKDSGYTVIDCDEITHDILDRKSIIDALVSVHGKEILNADNTINRKKLGDILFNGNFYNAKLQQHSKFMQKYIYEEIKLQLSQCNDDIVFIDVPLLLVNIKPLYDSGIIFDSIVVVTATEENQLKWLMKRNSYNEIKAKSIINSQLTSYKLLAITNYSDYVNPIYVLKNNATMDCLINEFKNIFKFLLT